MRDFTKILKTALICGLFGAIYGGALSALGWSLFFGLWGAILGLKYGLCYGYVFGVIGGILGGRDGWISAGIMSGTAALFILPWVIATALSPWISVVGCMLGASIAKGVGSESSWWPLVNGLREIINTSPLPKLSLGRRCAVISLSLILGVGPIVSVTMTDEMR